MAKVEGPQEIPSELLDGYRAAMGEIRPDDGVRKRYPYRVPTTQTLVGHPSTKQKTRRTNFHAAVEAFNELTLIERLFLFIEASVEEPGMWYFNYFIKKTLE